MVYLRENYVVRERPKMHKLGLFFVHGGYFIGTLQYAMTEMMPLRILCLTGCVMVMFYQFTLPRCQWLTVWWHVLYTVIIFYQITMLLGDPPPIFPWEEEKLHAMFKSCIDARHFHEILKVGEWLWLVDGAVLMQEGTETVDAQLTFVTEGTCQVCIAGERVAEVGAGALVGEVGLLTTGETTGTVAAAGCVRCFSVPVRRLLELLDSQPQLRMPLARLFGSTLAAKAEAIDEGMPVQTYRAVLEVACSLDEYEGISKGVEECRLQYGLSAELHEQLMEELPQCVHKPFRISPLARGLQAGALAGEAQVAVAGEVAEAVVAAAGEVAVTPMGEDVAPPSQ